MTQILAAFAKDESGSAVTEYSLIATLISIAIIASAVALGGALDNTYGGIADDAF